MSGQPIIKSLIFIFGTEQLNNTSASHGSYCTGTLIFNGDNLFFVFVFFFKVDTIS